MPKDPHKPNFSFQTCFVLEKKNPENCPSCVREISFDQNGWEGHLCEIISPYKQHGGFSGFYFSKTKHV
jgi:hypothetical protein